MYTNIKIVSVPYNSGSFTDFLEELSSPCSSHVKIFSSKWVILKLKIHEGIKIYLRHQKESKEFHLFAYSFQGVSLENSEGFI